MPKSKFETRNTTVKLKTNDGHVHASVCYMDGEPISLNLTYHEETEEGLKSNFIHIPKDSMGDLLNLIAENELDK